MEVRLLGPLEAVDGGVALAVRGAKQRALLAVLALQRGDPVSADRLIDLLWGDGSAANPANALQAQIRQLRRTLGAASVVTTEAGYALDADDLDFVQFENQVGKGCRLVADGDATLGSCVLGEALRLRRGEPLVEFLYAGFGDAERAHLNELTLVALEARAGADLALGRHGELVGSLEALCREHPLRERLWELLILALYRDGRQAEALQAYAEVRDHLVEELGIEPGPALRELEVRVLAQDPLLAAPAQPRLDNGPSPLLETKLHVPRQPRGVVARPRLIDRLGRAASAPLTLVSAPAGFGKTTLLTEWLAPGGPSAAWLSLDERDNDPALFWTYVVSALRSVTGNEIGAGALSLLQSSQAPLDAVLATLVNDLFALTDDVVLVLDDYHVIEAREVHDGMAFLVEHLPPQVHLVIATRSDPSMPLGRLRGRGDLVEIRAADLRFTADESTTYLSAATGSALSAQDVAALEERTEGWIVALQLAALSIQGREDVASFIADFAGTDRYIVDYLAEEVLEHLPEEVRVFLLQTSILDRLSGPLCDAVTGTDGGKVTLAALERANLFLVPLDDHRSWYRYHHLFADVLRAHLFDGQPGKVSGLHRRASDWYHTKGEAAEAIRHALAGGDFDRAADLAELAIPAIRRSRREATFRGWVKALPDEVVRVRPVLNVGVVGATLLAGEVEGVEDRLRDAERWLDAPTEQMVVVDEEEFRFLPGAIKLYRAALALAAGDVPAGVAHASRVLEISPVEDHHGRAAAAGLLGLVWWASGDLDPAYQAWAECVAGLRQAGSIADILGCSIALADIRMVQGRLGDAMGIYQRAVQLVADQGPVLRGTADMHVGMSQVHRERGDLEAARRHLLHSQELGEHNGLPQNPYRWRVAMAGVVEAEGDLDGAAELLDDAVGVYVGDMFPNVRPVPALRARLSARQGELEDALGWVRERGLSVDDDLSYLGELEHITLARILLAKRGLDGSFLERLLAAAEAGGRTGSVIEILVLQALAYQADRDIPGALTALRRAVTLAEPEGYVRVFADEGASMASLLQALVKQGNASKYVRRLLAATGTTEPHRPAKQRLIDPLSERELDVLRLLGTDLDGPEIARELMVSLNTMRTHTKNIYTKLGVTNRRAAVRQGEELQLLSRRR